jgi:hypothetical protein
VTGSGPYTLTLDGSLDKAYTTTATSKIYMVPDAYVVRNVTIKNLGFVGTSTFQVTSHVTGMFCDGVTIEDCDFDGVETSSIEFHLSRNITVRRCTAGNAFDSGTGGKGNLLKCYKCSGIDASYLLWNGKGDLRHFCDFPYCSNVLVHDVQSTGGCNSNGGEFSADHGLAGVNIAHRNVKALGAVGVGHPTYLSGGSASFENAYLEWIYLRGPGAADMTDVAGSHLMVNINKKGETVYGPGDTTITRGVFKNVVGGSVGVLVLGGENAAVERGVGNFTLESCSFWDTKNANPVLDLSRNDLASKTIAATNTSIRATGAAYCVILGGGAAFTATTVTFINCAFDSGQAKVLSLGANFAGTITLTNCTANGVLITDVNHATYIDNASTVTPTIN